MRKRYIIGLVVSIAALWLFFVQVPFSEMVELFTQIDMGLLALSLVFYWLTYLVRTYRWQILLRPVGKIAFGDALAATLIGFMGNNLLPARLGEFIRAYVVKKFCGFRASASMASIVMERVFDGLTALLFLITVLVFMDAPTDSVDSFISSETLRQAGVAGGVLFGGMLVFFQLIRWKLSWCLSVLSFLLKPFPQKIQYTLTSIVIAFSKGLNLVSLQAIVWVSLLSILLWGMISLFTLFVFFAFNLDMSFLAAMLVQVVLVLAMVIPSSPGGVGVYHLAAANALMYLGVQSGVAGSVAMLLWLIHYVVTNVTGLFSIWKKDLGLGVLSSKTARGSEDA